ncbi:hypothetical protein [Pedobacter sp. R20-19]|uniref:hypothetical protein n=1 Tax=Pedobacter sp. R20-19 TaxID=1270196 RepID=UPI00055B7B19|nr:hypothetical protein [Pedobacter sp. R20-19]
MTISVPIYTLAIIAMFYMDTFLKAMMFMVLVLMATFILFLCINYPLPSALSVVVMMAFFAIKI